MRRDVGWSLLAKSVPTESVVSRRLSRRWFEIRIPLQDKLAFLDGLAGEVCQSLLDRRSPAMSRPSMRVGPRGPSMSQDDACGRRRDPGNLIERAVIQRRAFNEDQFHRRVWQRNRLGSSLDEIGNGMPRIRSKSLGCSRIEIPGFGVTPLAANIQMTNRRDRKGRTWHCLVRPTHSSVLRNRRALLTTDSELRLMATLAKTGEIKRPKTGYSRPAATGTLAML